ncbi:MAG: hypothetical protein EWV91_09900 [Microcystis aeruginosa Ma_QC_Ca_00000000_S207]|uniref:Uncharacterized protein n=1 Tax=Microcystis aeruginosa Ma_QC_Ca_00000000_S207 TaxID=2486251 RepID=A0A552FN06_MICAE|nr:MAG: hypothetical protein EWV91_09900 [Microcystis aeruginosa Ma_QC_Ca_00000000_S207]
MSQKIPNYLRAIAKSLASVVGPFGVPVEFVLSLYDDQIENSREDKLDAMIAEGQSLTRESLDAIFETKTEIKELREQFILGIQFCFSILMQNQELLQNSENFEDKFSLLLDRQKEKLEEAGFLTKDVLVKELSELYGADSELFKATVGSAGFPLATIPQNQAPKVIVFQFINRCYTLKLNDQFKIFKALHKENPNSKVLQLVSALLQEKSSNQI